MNRQKELAQVISHKLVMFVDRWDPCELMDCDGVDLESLAADVEEDPKYFIRWLADDTENATNSIRKIEALCIVTDLIELHGLQLSCKFAQDRIDVRLSRLRHSREFVA